jgi:predicted ATPase
VLSGEINQDPKQMHVLKNIQDLCDALKLSDEVIHEKLTVEANGGLFNWFSSSTTTQSVQRRVWRKVQGLYIYGKPGSGKTFLMDLFYNTVDGNLKRRVHFNKFMLEVQERIHHFSKAENVPKELRGSDPVPIVAADIAKTTRLLCFDEFQVTDIADAMILKRLFGRLWQDRVVVFATSNRTPDHLYYNGLQRFLFLPFIDDLKENCKVIDLDSDTDYRYGGTHKEFRTFIFPLDFLAEEAAQNAFVKITGESKGDKITIDVMQGRTVTCRNATDKCGLFTFKDLCERPLGAADYIAIAQKFPYVILTEIPMMSISNRDVMRRFILLIDELYNRKVKLVCTAACGPDGLFQDSDSVYDESFAFSRTLSRLQEMQSVEYMDVPHESHN